MNKSREEESMKKRSIITVVGQDTVGIIAKVCTYLAENDINILDISQTIVQGYFNIDVYKRQLLTCIPTAHTALTQMTRRRTA